MKISLILKYCMEIKKEKKTIYSNYYNKYNDSNIEFDVIEGQGTIVFGLKEEFIYRVYFFSNNLKTLKELLTQVRSDAVTDYICKENIGEIGELIEQSGWKKYAEYARTMLSVSNIQKKKTKMELMLEKMYNPNIAILANQHDIPAIRKMMFDTFDPVNSEIIGEQELQKLIEEETVWLCKVDDKITTCYIYRIEGKKRYGMLTYNCLSADYLYSVTRRAHEISNVKHKPEWHYGWINLENTKIIRTLKSTDDLKLDGVKNFIYKKLNN